MPIILQPPLALLRRPSPLPSPLFRPVPRAGVAGRQRRAGANHQLCAGHNRALGGAGRGKRIAWCSGSRPRPPPGRRRTNATWLHLSPANQSGTGSTNVIFSYDANPGATRSDTLTIAGQTLTVTQAGSTYVAAGPVTTLVPIVGYVEGRSDPSAWRWTARAMFTSHTWMLRRQSRLRSGRRQTTP